MANEVKLKLAIEGGQVVGATLDGVSSKLDGVDKSARGASGGVGELKGMLAGIATIGTAMELIHMADACTTLRTSLKLASNSAAEAEVAYQRLFEIAQQSRVGFTALGDTYATIARAGNALGVTQDRLLTVTQAIGMAMTIGGGSAQSMQAALVQLGQGLSSGTLRGEELNSILEQTPRLAKALADGMGVSVGQLRSLGEQGKLTAETVIGALEKSAPQLAKEMGSATVTVGQAFTMLTNSVTKFVGDADTASGASGNLAGVLQGLSGAVGTVGNAIKQHETAFSAITSGLAAATVAVGIAATASAVGTLTIRMGALGAVMLANPVLAGIALIAAAGAGIASLASDWKKSAEGMRAQMDGINADIRLAEERAANGSEPVKARAALELQTLKDKRDALRQTMVVQEQSSAENASYNAKEMKLLQERVAAEQSAYAGAKPLDEVRKMAKLRNDILIDANDQAVNIAKAFNKSMANAASPEEAIALARERDKRLIANAQETTAALKGFDDQKAAPAREAAKQRLDTVVQYYEALQIESTAGEQRASQSLAAQHAAGLVTDQDYYEQKRTLAENDNIAQQALVELEIEAVKKSGLNKQDQKVQLDKFNQDLTRLREAAKGIEANYVNEMTVLDMKLFRQGVEQSADYIEAQQVKAASLRDQVKAQRQANAEIGLSATQVNDLRAATMRLTASQIELRAAEVADPRAAEALRNQARYMRELADANTEAVQKASAVESFKSLWSSVDQTAHGVWTNIYQGGQDTFTKLRDTLKATVWDLLYQMTVRKWIFNIVASVTGGTVAGAAQAAAGGAGGAGNIGDALGLANLFGAGGAISEGISTMGAAMINGPFSSMLGDFGASLVANSSAIASAIPWIGAGLAAFSVLKGAMDYKIVHLGDALTADFKSSGVTSVGTLSTDRQEGGLFGGGTTINGTWGVADAGTTGYIDASVKAATASSKAYAAAIGLSADALDGFTQSVVINTSGMDAAATKAAIDAAVVKFQNDQLASAYGDSLQSVARDGETTAQTMRRLATDLTAANQIMGVLGHTLFDVSTAGAAAASAFVQAMGGMAVAQSQMTAYYQGFYSKDEQRANVINDQIAQLAAVGITSTYADLAGADKATLRQAVEAFSKKKDTEEGAKQYAAVVKAANALLPTLETVAAAKPVLDASVSAASTAGYNAASSVTSAANSIAQAMQAGANDIWGEVKRIHGLMDASGGAQGLADLQAQYVTLTARARAGSADAAKALPALVQALLPLLDATAGTQQDMQRQRGQIAASLTDTGNIISSQYGLTIPAFAGGGSHAGGWAMVGEQGPELAYMPPARIYTANQTRSLIADGAGGNAELAAALRAMADALDAIEANTEAAAISSAALAKMLARVIPEDDDEVIAVKLVVPKGEFVPVRAV